MLASGLCAEFGRCTGRYLRQTSRGQDPVHRKRFCFLEVDGGGAARCVLVQRIHMMGGVGQCESKGLYSASEVRNPICERESCRIAARLLECRLVTIAGQELHHLHVVWCWACCETCQTLSVGRRKIPGLLGSCAHSCGGQPSSTPQHQDGRRWAVRSMTLP
jgi:hypothetical protein